MNRIARCCCEACEIEVAGEPVLNAICHCDNCKRRTGSAFGWSAYFADDSVVARRGELARFEPQLHRPPDPLLLRGLRHDAVLDLGGVHARTHRHRGRLLHRDATRRADRDRDRPEAVRLGSAPRDLVRRALTALSPGEPCRMAQFAR